MLQAFVSHLNPKSETKVRYSMNEKSQQYEVKLNIRDIILNEMNTNESYIISEFN